MASVVHRDSGGWWGGVVHRWNRLTPPRRAEIARACATAGHDWRLTSVEGARMCARCCEWAKE